MHRAGWKWLLAVVAVWTAAGCSGGGTPPVQPSRLEVGFDKPAEGQGLTAADDADPATDGFQYEVVATARDTAGRAVTLASATLELRQAGSEEWTPGPAAIINAAGANFPATQLFVPATELRVTVAEQGSERTATRTATVQVDAAAPTVALASPGEGQVLNATADADPSTVGYQVRFTVETSGLTGRTGTLRCSEACGLAETSFTVEAGGTTQVTATLGTAGCETQASCTAVVDDRGISVTSSERRFQVDTVLPALSVSAPEAERLGSAGDASSAGGYQLRVAATTSVDVGTDGVRLELGPSGEAVTVTPADGAVTHDFTVPASGEQAYTLTLTATDDAGNTSTATREVVVDLQPLPITLESPAEGSTHEIRELNQAVSVRVQVPGGDGRQVRIFSQSGTQPEALRGELTVAGGVAQGSLTFPPGVQTVTAEVSDEVGNVSRDGSADVRVVVPSCAVVLTTPAGESATLLARDDRDTTWPGLQYRMEGQAPGCPGGEVHLFRDGDLSNPIASATAAAGTGAFSFDVELQDGEQAHLTARALNAVAEESTDSVDVTVDLTVPVVAVSPSVTDLFFVAANNANLYPVATPTPGYLADLEPGGDATADLQVTVTQGQGGTLQFFYRDAPASAAVPVVDGQQTAVRVTLPHDTSGSLELRVTDASGNEVRRAATATVDVVAPSPITITRRELTNARAATVEVEWTASGDDGSSGTPAGYDLRWTTNAQAPNGIDGYETFFNPRTAKQEGGALRPASETSATLTLPPLARYSIEVTPRDEVGNFADFTPQPPAEQLRNLWRQVTLANPVLTAGGYQTYQSGRGDLNGDGRADLVLGAAVTGAPGAAYVYYGTPDPVGQPPLRQLIDMGGNNAQFFGADLDLGDVGNATAEDRVDDLIISARTWHDTTQTPAVNGRGRVFLFFGNRGGILDTAAALELRGARTVSGNFGGTVKMLSDLNGDGLREVAIAAHNESPGRVYIFFGRSQAAWRALLRNDDTGATCGSGPECVIPADSADVKIAGDAGMAFFGRARGYARMGDVDGDGVPDFSVPTSNDSLHRLWIFSGAQATAGANLTLAQSLTSLTGVADTTPTNSNAGFGGEAFGDVDLVGGSAFDLVVSQAKLDRVFLYRDGDLAAAPTVFNGTGLFGSSLRVGDLNGDGRPDLIFGQNRTPSSAFFFFNRGTPGDEFDATQGVGFSQSMLEPLGRQGITVGVLDFNGDGLLDVSVGDTATNAGQVVVYY